MRINFKVWPHKLRPVDVVEVTDDFGRLLATITPSDKQGIRILSKHIVVITQSGTTMVEVEFKIPGLNRG